MVKTRRITADVPEDLLEAAQAETGKGVTETIVEGLRQVRRERMDDPDRRRRFAEKLMALHGKLKLDIDVDELRGRPAEQRGRRR